MKLKPTYKIKPTHSPYLPWRVFKRGFLGMYYSVSHGLSSIESCEDRIRELRRVDKLNRGEL